MNNKVNKEQDQIYANPSVIINIDAIKKALCNPDLWTGDFYGLSTAILNSKEVELKLTSKSIYLKVTNGNEILTYDFSAKSL